MKSAEEVADKIIMSLNHIPTRGFHELMVETLKAFADERVKEAVMTMSHNEAVPIIRNEAIEDAAKIADKRCQCPHHISIAFEIRALKR